MSSWIDVPEGVNDQKTPDSIRYDDGELLLKYSDDSVVMKIYGVNESVYEDILEFAENESFRFKLEIMSVISEAEKITRYGTRGDLPSDVSEQFRRDCPECSSRSKFQLISSQWRGTEDGSVTSAECMKCGGRLSVILSYCETCQERVIFAKERLNTDDFYECIYCGSELS